MDMSKGYDLVEWSFPKGMLLTMGFATSWVEFIIHCLKTVIYSILVNGKEGQKFHATRGLKQGDLLSPYLFLIYSEGLSTLMRLAEKEGLIEGAKVSRSGLKISHLLFADDNILFGEASKRGHMYLWVF
ncbi:hypothetical protein J1N35_034767 [Gossypium stocksii]|uniref:Reverse transcriptase domain-containing protein n=1 Tax=Gossypium stocksii TaxID=47602 RepID=A0A9D3USP3_9ROSI|nr:hypothetical protein J1N35_034767 [Gossypium stocksii]